MAYAFTALFLTCLEFSANYRTTKNVLRVAYYNYNFISIRQQIISYGHLTVFTLTIIMSGRHLNCNTLRHALRKSQLTSDYVSLLGMKRSRKHAYMDEVFSVVIGSSHAFILYNLHTSLRRSTLLVCPLPNLLFF